MSEHDLLERARLLVDGQRAIDYGDMHSSFTRIAGLWGAYLGVQMKPDDVAYMMTLLKISRLRGYKAHMDSLDDAVGYLLCADRVKDNV